MIVTALKICFTFVTVILSKVRGKVGNIGDKLLGWFSK